MLRARAGRRIPVPRPSGAAGIAGRCHPHRHGPRPPWSRFRRRIAADARHRSTARTPTPRSSERASRRCLHTSTPSCTTPTGTRPRMPPATRTRPQRRPPGCISPLPLSNAFKPVSAGRPCAWMSGSATFAPIRTERVEDHPMHEERYALPLRNGCGDRAHAERRREGRRGWTTVVRVPRDLRERDGKLRAGSGSTSLFIHPGHHFRAIDGLLTNFHQPRSSLLVLLAAFIGDERWRSAYAHALGAGYRFLSLGDCMLCWRAQ